MACCCASVGATSERQFGTKKATEDLAQYRKKGAGVTAKLLLAGLAKAGPLQGQLLDVGSGIGALTFELLDRGLASAVGVDLSSANVAAASEEAARRGRPGAVRFVHGDFLDVADHLPAADVVTLDRVVCCYPEYERLLSASLRHAGRYFALSYPRSVWYVRTWVRIENLGRQMARNAFRTFVHSAAAMENVIRDAGFRLVRRSCTRTWRADVYEHAR